MITTFHKAKGLEWDQVFLTSCSNYEFPAGSGYSKAGYTDHIQSQQYYVRDHLDIQAETLEQLRMLFKSENTEIYREGVGTQVAYDKFVSERMRLLYVGITRAKKGLYISWNGGRYESSKNTEALAVTILREKWENEQ